MSLIGGSATTRTRAAPLILRVLIANACLPQTAPDAGVQRTPVMKGRNEGFQLRARDICCKPRSITKKRAPMEVSPPGLDITATGVSTRSTLFLELALDRVIALFALARCGAGGLPGLS